MQFAYFILTLDALSTEYMLHYAERITNFTVQCMAAPELFDLRTHGLGEKRLLHHLPYM